LNLLKRDKALAKDQTMEAVTEEAKVEARKTISENIELSGRYSTGQTTSHRKRQLV
jgi:hypothetical protein